MGSVSTLVQETPVVSGSTALGITHSIGGMVRVLGSRIEKVARWPVPSDQSRVRAFLGVVGITKRWVKNFAELARPFTRLTGKVSSRWDLAEQLSFEILRIKCYIRSAMYRIDLIKIVYFYIDTTTYIIDLTIIRFILIKKVDVSIKDKLIKVLIIYKFFLFTTIMI